MTIDSRYAKVDVDTNSPGKDLSDFIEVDNDDIRVYTILSFGGYARGKHSVIVTIKKFVYTMAATNTMYQNQIYPANSLQLYCDYHMNILRLFCELSCSYVCYDRLSDDNFAGFPNWRIAFHNGIGYYKFVNTNHDEQSIVHRRSQYVFVLTSLNVVMVSFLTCRHLHSNVDFDSDLTASFKGYVATQPTTPVLLTSTRQVEPKFIDHWGGG